jgi:hypothetical protein
VQNPTLSHYTRHSPQQPALARCVQAMYALHVGAPASPYEAVKEKYAHTRYHHVSLLPAARDAPRLF